MTRAFSLSGTLVDHLLILKSHFPVIGFLFLSLSTTSHVLFLRIESISFLVAACRALSLSALAKVSGSSMTSDTSAQKSLYLVDGILFLKRFHLLAGLVWLSGKEDRVALG